MKTAILSSAGFALLALSSVALASQTAGTEMTHSEGHGYGMMGGYMGGWIAYGVVKAAVVVIGLWFLHRIARAMEKIAASKGSS